MFFNQRDVYCVLLERFFLAFDHEFDTSLPLSFPTPANLSPVTA